MAQKVKEWITVNGQHVPIFEGQSKQEAVNNAIKNQQNVAKGEDTKERQIAANKKEADEKNNKQLENAIKAYTAKGGEHASENPFTAEKKKLLEAELSQNKYKTEGDIFRGISVSEKEWQSMFDKMYNGNTLDINLDGLQSFTKERTRSFGYGSGEQKIIYKIEKGTILNGDDISNRSFYPEEKEVLLANNKMKATYNDIEWLDNGTVILTLHKKE